MFLRFLITLLTKSAGMAKPKKEPMSPPPRIEVKAVPITDMQRLMLEDVAIMITPKPPMPKNVVQVDFILKRRV